MAQGARPFEAIKVSMIGVESGLDRFTKDGNVQMPPVARWRNNLTALSSHENLFFIAFERVVAVYEPEFPFQTLRRTPALLIEPELCNPAAPGFINQHRDESPHAINHLIVGELGSQEILLFATDSGNVEAYYTSSIAEAVRKVAEQRREVLDRNAQVPPSADTSLRPFFCEWVKRSAWGLAIHKDARMIAVSANVPNDTQPSDSTDTSAIIVVFAFSLTSHELSFQPETIGGDVDVGNASVWLDWVPNGGQAGPPRNRNYKVVLAGWNGHGHNIPNISFVNSTEDHEGTWLMSTDTAGIMQLWQIWKRTCHNKWLFGHVGRNVQLTNHEFPGWNVAALDISCFRPCRNLDEFVGSSRVSIYHDYHQQGPSFNLTPIVRRHTPNYSELHPEHPDALSDRDESDGDDIHSTFDPSGDEQQHPDNTNITDHSSPANRVPSRTASAVSDAADFEMHDVEIFHEQVEFHRDVNSDEESSEDDDYHHGYSDSGDEEESEDLSINESLRSPASRMNGLQRQRIASRGGGLALNQDHIPSFAILHCTDSHVRMLAGPRERFAHVFCAHMLKQLLPEHVYTHHRGLEFLHMDRLNMIHVIRELGIVLIASQAGRVALCSLGRSQDGLVGFRVDWIIPTKRQERQGMRPSFCTLIGMAVSPVQGRYSDQELSTTSTDDDEDSSWYQDGDVDGVDTTFDPEVVVLSPRLSEGRSTVSTKQESKKRGRADADPAPAVKTDKHSWKKSPDVPSWTTTENSRRYRVMLTYSDMTVLTYEIWRGVERGDKANDGI